MQSPRASFVRDEMRAVFVSIYLNVCVCKKTEQEHLRNLMIRKQKTRQLVRFMNKLNNKVKRNKRGPAVQSSHFSSQSSC